MTTRLVLESGWGNEERSVMKKHYRAGKAEKQCADAQNPARLSPGLYLVATPIGNAGDLTARAAEVLAAADILFCEDTRVTQKLLGLHGITGKKLAPAHEHNEAAQAVKICALIREGKVIAYASDAGLPLISDPGAKLVEHVVAEGCAVTSLPGANAAMTALQLSSLPATPFYFAGFLPPKSAARRKALDGLKTLEATLVFYEAPHRMLECLADMYAALGNRRAAYARELTKLHEEVRRGTLTELHAALEARESIRGECVIIVAGADAKTADAAPATQNVDALLRAALKTLSPRDAAFDVAARTGLKRRDVYQRLLEMQGKKK